MKSENNNENHHSQLEKKIKIQNFITTLRKITSKNPIKIWT